MIVVVVADDRGGNIAITITITINAFAEYHIVITCVSLINIMRDTGMVK